MQIDNLLRTRWVEFSALCSVIMLLPAAANAAEDSTAPSVEERLKQQDQQIRDLQQRLSLVESSAM